MTNGFKNCPGFLKIILIEIFQVIVYKAQFLKGKFVSKIMKRWWVLKLYSGFKAKMCTTFLALAWLGSLSACSNAYDSHLRSHSQDVLPIWATKINVYGHRSQESTIFCLKKKSDILWCSLGSSDHIHWFQWLQLAIHHGYVTLDESHMHWNQQKDL